MIAALISAALVVLIFRVGRHRRASVALLLFLAGSVVANFCWIMADAQTQTYRAAVFITLAQAVSTMDGFFVACFGAMFLAERTRVPKWLRSFPTFLVPAGALCALVILRPELAFDFREWLSHALVADAPESANPWAHPQALVLVDRVTDLAWVIAPFFLVRWAVRQKDDREAAPTILIAVALASVFAFYAGTEVALHSLTPGPKLAIILTSLAFQAGLVVMFIHHGARANRERRTLAWGAALFIVTMWALGAWVVDVWEGIIIQLARSALIGLPFPLIATYALLRHQLLGLDVRLRFAISKSSIAAVFIAVFFIASEAAQQFFGETLGSTYVGIAAAGLLVFAMAPLQRVAERLAEKAIPTGGPAPPTTHTNEDLYRRALRIALVDRTIERHEELTLAELSERLHIGHKRALELRHEIEGEAASSDTDDERGIGRQLS